MEHYDLCVIGGGPAGYAAAMRALDLGKRTVLIEKDRIGGTGIYNGALTSKTLWELAQRVTSANEVVRIRGREPFRLDWDDITRTLNEAVFERKYLYACHMQLLASQGESGRFRHERGTASFSDPHHVRIVRAGERITISADHFIIATGSRPRDLKGITVDERHILTSDGIFDIDDLPSSIVIVGAGVIGCEFATIFSNLGRTRVHLIDRAERILPFEDEDVSQLIARGMERNGTIIHQAAQLCDLHAEENGVCFTLDHPDGRKETIHVDKALLSVGRVPNLEGLGLEAAGVATVPKSGALVMDGTATSQPHIHAIGDANGTNMLVNLGEMEGRHAVEQCFGITSKDMDLGHVSTIMFLDPEVAGVGLNEQACQAQGIPYRVARIDYSCLARAIAMRRTRGFFKLIVTDDDDMHVLGMRAVGEHASSAIQGVALMMRLGIPVRELAEMVHPHPSIIEGVQECARILMGTSIFKPEVFKDKMAYRRWRPVQAGVKAA